MNSTNFSFWRRPNIMFTECKTELHMKNCSSTWKKYFSGKSEVRHTIAKMHRSTKNIFEKKVLRGGTSMPFYMMAAYSIMLSKFVQKV
jgi:hypothetical protein